MLPVWEPTPPIPREDLDRATANGHHLGKPYLRGSTTECLDCGYGIYTLRSGEAKGGALTVKCGGPRRG